jgi:MFS family permease
LSFISLLRREPGLVTFGFVFTFGSSVGQTFFFSVFVPGITGSLAITPATLATLYSLATLASGFSLPWIGGIIDRTDISRFALAAGLGLLLACLLLASAQTTWVLVIALFLLRLFGQGLMIHTALTGVARYFVADRAKALSLAGLGNAAGEGLLPLVAVSAIALVGWRATYASAGLIVALVLVPLALWLIADKPDFRRVAETANTPARRRRHAFHLLRVPAFWLLMAPLLMTPLTITALIFHHSLIADSKQLSLAVFAAAFVGYAAVQLPAALYAGALIDRLGARLPLLLHLAPMAVGIAILLLFDVWWAVWCYLVLAGVTSAICGILRTYVVAQMVPLDELGAARSLLTAMMVIATAAGPALYGWLYASLQSVELLLSFSVASVVLAGLPPLFAPAERTLPPS